MQQTSKVERPQPHIVDYSAARAKAIAWLGDRYLLAKPINRKTSPPPSVPLSTPGTLGLLPAGPPSRRPFNHLRVVGGSYESSNDSVASGAGSVGRLAVDGAG
jgi:hypothetical protein